ncbi:hypothetical protein ACSBL2_01440 [Pedobacter sp. AW31-3R]|uniref:hypothetical protein n=1 Tax=Pedobacter sp. AW31-3R TaxID=3445781 RepID=UPI003F9F9912
MRKYVVLAFLFMSSQMSYSQWTVTGDDIKTSNAGNVFIGSIPSATLNPKLGVHQSSVLGTVAGSSTLLRAYSGSTTNTFQNNLWLLRNAEGASWLTARLHDGISIDVSYRTPQTNTRTWWERDPYNDIQSWGNIAQNYFTINKGKVGVGTASPSQKLDVAGNLYLRNMTNETGAGSSISLSSYDLTHLGPKIYSYLDMASGTASRSRLILSSYANGYQNELVLNGGNVGIGTMTPGEKLSVNGAIRSHMVTVETKNWPDYVFEKDYKKRSLSEVEQFVAKHKHLPDMPSAKDITAHGQNLGEVNKLLVKKVEELTLYLIELNKQLLKQQQLIEHLAEREKY